MHRKTQAEAVVKAEWIPTARSHKESDQSKQGIHPSLITSSNSSSTTNDSCTHGEVMGANGIRCKDDYEWCADHNAPPWLSDSGGAPPPWQPAPHSDICDDLPIPTLFSLSLLSSPVLNMMLNCINYALCFMTMTDTWNEALVKIPWYRFNSWTWTTTYNSRTIKVHGPPLPTRRLRKVQLQTTRKDAN